MGPALQLFRQRLCLAGRGAGPSGSQLHISRLIAASPPGHRRGDVGMCIGMPRAQAPTNRVTASAKRAAARRALPAAGGAAPSASERIASECICSRLRLLNRVVSSIYDEALRPYRLEISQLSLLIAIDLLRERATGARVAAAVQSGKRSSVAHL